MAKKTKKIKAIKALKKEVEKVGKKIMGAKGTVTIGKYTITKR